MSKLHTNRSRHNSDLGPRRSARHARVLGAGLAAVGIFGGLATTTLSLAGPASASETTPAATTPPITAWPTDKFGEAIRGHLHLAPNMPDMTRLLAQPGKDTHENLPMSTQIRPGAPDSWQESSWDNAFMYSSESSQDDAELQFRYRIDGTNFTLNGSVKVPNMWHRENHADCYIGDGSGQRVDAATVPYSCSWTWGKASTDDPQPHFYIAPKERVTVTDPKQQAELLEQLSDSCLSGDPNVGCRFDPVVRKTEVLGEKKVVGGVNNNGSSTLDKAVTWTDTTEASASHGWSGSGTVGLKIKKVLEVSTTWEGHHDWTETTSQSFSESTTLHVPPHRWQVLSHQGAFDEFMGTFVISTRDKIYVMPGAVFDFPLNHGYETVDEFPATPSSPPNGPGQAVGAPQPTRATS